MVRPVSEEVRRLNAAVNDSFLWGDNEESAWTKYFKNAFAARVGMARNFRLCRQRAGSAIAHRARQKTLHADLQQRLLPRREWRERQRAYFARSQFHRRTPCASYFRRRARHAHARL